MNLKYRKNAHFLVREDKIHYSNCMKNSKQYLNLNENADFSPAFNFSEAQASASELLKPLMPKPNSLSDKENASILNIHDINLIITQLLAGKKISH